MYYCDDAVVKTENDIPYIKKYSQDYFYALERRKNSKVLVKRRVLGYAEKPDRDYSHYANKDKNILLYHKRIESKNREDQILKYDKLIDCYKKHTNGLKNDYNKYSGSIYDILSFGMLE